MLVVDEYLAVRVIAGAWPVDLPDDDVAISTGRWWRLLQRIHDPGVGQLSEALASLNDGDREVVRQPDSDVLHVMDPRPLMDDAANLSARFGSGGMLVGESIAAGLRHGRQLWFGRDRNVGRRHAQMASALDITVHVLS